MKWTRLIAFALFSSLAFSSAVDEATDLTFKGYAAYNKQDYKQAAHWFTKAAEQGHAKAQYNLGSMYAKGEGVPQSYQQAVHWYGKAAEQGNTNAQHQLDEIERINQLKSQIQSEIR
jgi:TPR repeat protein